MESVSKREMGPAAILSLIGGVLMIAGGLAGMYMYSFWNQVGMVGGGPMMGGWGTSMGSFAGMMGVSSGISIAAGGVVLFGAYSIHTRPESKSAWGVGILVASVVGLFSMGGFLIGPVLGIIGGILALTKK